MSSTAAPSAVHPYVAALLGGLAAEPGAPDWLAGRRSAALERANALTVPTTRDEEWRFTDLTPLTRLPVQPAVQPSDVDATMLSAHALPEAALGLTFIDGILRPGQTVAALPAGVTVLPLAEALRTRAALVEPYLTRLAATENDLFSALNTVFLQQGVLIHLARDAVLDSPVHLLHVAAQAGVAAHPRCLIVAEAGARVCVIEDYVAIDDIAYLTNTVTEVAVAGNAEVRHIRVQRESAKAFHIGTCAVRLDRDARFSSHTVSLGARLSRQNLSVVQTGEGVDVTVDGLALIGGRQLADTHTLIDHCKAHGRCAQTHKTIVGGGAHAVFNGKVFVREGAQLTDSSQQSRNLLLSDKARVDTKPQLEIFADDVKCAHGATVGQLDPEHLFYLKSRGLTEAAARNMLTYAFGAEIIDRIPVPTLVRHLEAAVMAFTEGGA